MFNSVPMLIHIQKISVSFVVIELLFFFYHFVLIIPLGGANRPTRA